MKTVLWCLVALWLMGALNTFFEGADVWPHPVKRFAAGLTWPFVAPLFITRQMVQIERDGLTKKAEGK